MVKRFSMESQDMRMCMNESVFSGVTVDYNTHRVCEEDCFGDILNMLDFPMESLEVDGFAEDWASKLGPIPSEVFKEVMPPPGSQIGGGNNFGSYTDLPLESPVLNNKTSQQKYHPNHNEETYKNCQNVKISQLEQQTTYVEEEKSYPAQASFEASSPNSVLESRTSSSNNKGISFGTEISIPVRTRSKRLRPTTNPWLMSPCVVLPNKDKRGKEPSQIPVTMETKRSPDVAGIKKCAHCEITETPQWREGPMGPKTLCNACGVRYRSGRLYPEYRPAASPTFVPALHSNSHRKVIEMRQKAVM
ncbi:hypothetical protein L1987_34678 [Smallanthus sonchifolius]|uniref:Uncharacterized protein n=1 Tax=Smallanthus sonchifolius TaxID=185202 RepID=A0ACB9HVQ8_9ASTR|nr:hypothetical protein L1987_34678 [Smallanthus sonchifolius]